MKKFFIGASGICFILCGTVSFSADAAGSNLDSASVESAAIIADDGSTYDLGKVLVEGRLASKYREEEVSSLFFPVAPEKLPVVVDVLTADYIREQDANDIHDLLFNIPGIFGGAKSLYDAYSGAYTIRGRGGSAPTIDGIVDLPAPPGLWTDPNVFERVEISKGPVGALLGGKNERGVAGVGGSINLVQKTPDPARDFTEFEISTTFGDDISKFKFSGDPNFRIADGVYMRIPMGFDFGHEEFYMPHANDLHQSYTFAPSLLLEASSDLRFVVNALFQYLDIPGYQGIPSWRGKPLPPYDWDSYPAGHNDVRNKYFGYTLSGYAEWDANDVWQFRAGGAYSFSHVKDQLVGVSTYAQKQKAGVMPHVNSLNNSWEDSHDKSMNLYGRAIARYDFLGAENTTLIQTDLQRKKNFAYEAYREEQLGQKRFAPLTKDSADAIANDDVYISKERLDRAGLAVQQFMEFGMLNVLGGIRVDRHESDLRNKGTAWSPRTGIAFTPWDSIVLFGNFARTEVPNFGYMKNEYEELTSSWNTEQWECGARISPLKNLWLTLSYYWIESENVPSYVEETHFYEIEDNKIKNNGVEVSLAGDISKNWSIYAGYAHDRKKTIPGQHPVQSTPPHTVTLQTSYRVTGEFCKNLKLGLAVRYRHGYDAPLRGRYVGPDYFFDDVVVCDASAEVPFSMFGGSKDWSVRLGIDNLFNKKYFAANRHYYECFVGDPRTFKISIRGKF